MESDYQRLEQDFVAELGPRCTTEHVHKLCRLFFIELRVAQGITDLGSLLSELRERQQLCPPDTRDIRSLLVISAEVLAEDPTLCTGWRGRIQAAQRSLRPPPPPQPVQPAPPPQERRPRWPPPSPDLQRASEVIAHDFAHLSRNDLKYFLVMLGRPLIDRTTIERMMNNPNVSHVRIVLSALHHSLHILCDGDIAKLTTKIEKILLKEFSPPLKLLATNVARILRHETELIRAVRLTKLMS